MDKGTCHIRIGLPPCIVSGDYLASSSMLPLLFARACSMSDVRDLGVVLVRLTYLVMCGCLLAWYSVSHDGLCTILGQTIVLVMQPGSADAPQASLQF